MCEVNIHNFMGITHRQRRKDLQQPRLRDVDGIQGRVVQLFGRFAEPSENLRTTTILFLRHDTQVNQAAIIDIAVDMVNLLPFSTWSKPCKRNEDMHFVLMPLEHDVRIALSLCRAAACFLTVVILF